MTDHVEEIEGLLYRLRQQPDGLWIIHPPAGVGLPAEMPIKSFSMDGSAVVCGLEEALQVLHGVLEHHYLHLRIVTDLEPKERVVLDRCRALVERVASVPVLVVVRFLSPRIYSRYCSGCRNPGCPCSGVPVVMLARSTAQSFERTLEALVYSCALRGHQEHSHKHWMEIMHTYSRLVLQMAQGES